MFLHGIVSTISFFIFLPFFYVERCIHNKSFGWKEKFGNVECELDNTRKTVMLHACSVGEVNAIEHLAKRIKKQHPEYNLVITTGTKTGQDLAQKKFKEVAELVTYFPFDVPYMVDKFLDKVNPNLVFIAETEIWPNFAYRCKKRNIPVCIVNGRISDSTYRQYRIAKPFFSQVFKNFHSVLVQSDEDREKYIKIGMNPESVELMGNLKFDITAPEGAIDLGHEGFKVIVAGSTHDIENKIAIDTFERLRKDNSNVKLLIAPRHLEDKSYIVSVLEKAEIQYGFRSKEDNFKSADVIILDTLGELGKVYSICDIAYIGGSFSKTGGHNPLEATIFYKPTVSGPSVYNFKDIYRILTKADASKVVSNQEDFYMELRKLVTDESYYTQMSQACKSVFDSQKGAIDFVIRKLEEII